MNRIRVCIGLALTALPVFAQQNFAGKWEFNPSISKNVGMMTQIKLVATIQQTSEELIVSNVSTFNGQEQTSELRLNLKAKPVPNKNPMEATAETITKWDGKRLVTTWTSPGSVAGTQSVRTETRYLSEDGRTMTVESSRGKAPAMVMVYDHK
jgi:hypothetical protein